MSTKEPKAEKQAPSPVGFTIQNVDDFSIEAFFSVSDFGSVNAALEAAYGVINKKDGGFEESMLRAIYSTTPEDLNKVLFVSKTLRRAKIWKIAPLSLVQKRGEMLDMATKDLITRLNGTTVCVKYLRKYQCKSCHPNGKRELDGDYNHTFYGDFNCGGCKYPISLFTLDEDDKSVTSENEDEDHEV
jgi:hypothetical protein